MIYFRDCTLRCQYFIITKFFLFVLGSQKIKEKYPDAKFGKYITRKVQYINIRT